jgi:hypothetical protein
MARREGKSQAASVAQDTAAVAKDTARALGKPKEVVSGSLGVRQHGEGIFLGAGEAVAAVHFLGQGGDQGFAVDGCAEGGLDALDDLRHMQWGAGALEDVISHINLRLDFTRAPGGELFGRLAQTPDRAQLGLQGCFKNVKDEVTQLIVVHPPS